MTDSRHNDDIIITELRALKELLTLEITYLKKNLEDLEHRTTLNVETAKEQVAKFNERFNERITVIEIWQSNSMGKMAIIFTIIGILITGFVSWASKHF